MTGSLLVAASGVALLLATGTALARLDRLERSGGAFWLLALAAIVTGSLGLSASLKARSLQAGADAFRELDVVTAAELRRDLTVLKDRAVVVTDVGTCVELKAGAGGRPVLASRNRVSGEDEVEGEESDYVTTVEYGVEHEANRFRLGAEALGVQVDPDGWQVWPAGPEERIVTTTGEFSPAAGRNLNEVTVQTAIPCGATVSLTGVVTVEGPYITLAPLPRSLCLLTDRPWQAVLDLTDRQASGQQTYALWLAAAALVLALIQLGLAASLASKERHG